MTQPASTGGWFSKLSAVQKTVVNVLTLIVAVGAPTLNYLGVIHFPGDAVTILSVVVGIAGAILHYLVPNTTSDPAVAATQSVKLVSSNAAV